VVPATSASDFEGGYISLASPFGALFATWWLGEPVYASIAEKGMLAAVSMSVMNRPPIKCVGIHPVLNG